MDISASCSQVFVSVFVARNTDNNRLILRNKTTMCVLSLGRVKSQLLLIERGPVDCLRTDVGGGAEGSPLTG